MSIKQKSKSQDQSASLITIKFVEGDEAREIMLSSDKYFDIMTPFDRAIRMNSDRTDITRDEFGRYATSHIMKWEDDEVQVVSEFVGDIAKVLTEHGFKGEFPNPVRMIKTDGLEDVRECAGYCRKNTICINRRTLWNMNHRILAHGLFHIFTQNNPELCNELYRSIGFFRCNEIELPVDFRHRILTQSDSPYHNVYIDLTIVSPTDNRQVLRVVPVLFYDNEIKHSSPSVERSLFSKLSVKMLEIEKKNDTDEYKLVLINDNPVMHDVDEFSDFFTKIGKSHYYFHPEGILATRFADFYIYRKNNDEYMVMMGKLMFSNPPVPDVD